jgi:hypothetical protein
MDAGRKRPFCGVLATQRISKLSKDAAYECNNVMIGRSLGADAKRAGEELDLAPREAKQQLRKLPAGRFYVFGPAFSDEVRMVQVGKVVTTHPEPGKTPPPVPPTPEKVREILGSLKDLPRASAGQPRTESELRARVADLEKQLKTRPAEMVYEQVAKPVPVLTGGELDNLKALVAEAEAVHDRIDAAIDSLSGRLDDLGSAIVDIKAAIELNGVPEFVVRTPTNRELAAATFAADGKVPKRVGKHEIRVPEPSAHHAAPTEKSGIGTQQIVDGIAGIERAALPRTIVALAAWLNAHPRSSSFLRALGAARTDGLVDGLDLTPAGRQIVSVKASDESAMYVLQQPLSESQRRIIDTIASLEGQDITIAALAAWVGVHPRSSSFLKDLGKLRERGYVNGNELTAIGATAAESRKLDHLEILEQLDDLPRRIVEAAKARGEFKTIAELASQLDVHPRSSSFLGDIGKLRERGLVSKGWPLRLTDVFAGAVR